jgi:hypothetical protein
MAQAAKPGTFIPGVAGSDPRCVTFLNFWNIVLVSDNGKPIIFQIFSFIPN